MRRALLVLMLLAPMRSWADPPNPSFYLVNHGERQIDALYASPAEARNWGEDRLGDDVVLPGDYAAVRLRADGKCVYDLRVVFAGGRSEERRGLDVCAVDKIIFGDSLDRAARDATDPSFHLVNRGRVDLNEVYARLAGRPGWGTDRLGDDTVDAGAATDIRLPNGDCLWDLRFVFDDHRAVEKRRLNLCRLREVTVP